MVVNWYLAEKLVVNWELGTPISTLFWLALSFSSRFEFQHGAFASKTFARPKKTPALHARYFRDREFESNTLRDSEKRKISWQETGSDCYPRSGIHQNLDKGCGKCFACLSWIWGMRQLQKSTWQEISGVSSPILSSSSFLPLFPSASSY